MLNIDWIYNILYIDTNSIATIQVNNLYNNWSEGAKTYTKKFYEYKKEKDGYKWYIISSRDKLKRYFTPQEVNELKNIYIEKLF